MAEAVSGVAPHAFALFERPVSELGRHEQTGREHRCGAVEPGIVDDELDCVDAPYDHHRRRDEYGPAEYYGGHERDDPDDRQSHARSL